MGIKLNGLVIARVLAKQKMGKCLSKKYINNHTKMLWKCKHGHMWLANLNNIKDNGHWCPDCKINNLADKRRLTISVAKNIARVNNGKCLSNIYINSYTPIKWQCKHGHKWYARLNNIKHRKSWCPECGRIDAARALNNSYILYHWKTGSEIVCVASYEKAVVEYLNKNKINFRWQYKTFVMSGGNTYRPDLYLFSTRKWIEIKGYFREKNKKKWKWFHKKYPNSELWDKQKLEQMEIL